MTQTPMRPVERIFRYGISGGAIALLFSVSIIGLVRFLPAVGPVGASLIAFCIAQPFAYATHRMVTYPDASSAPDEKSARRVRFVITNLGGLVVATGGMALVTRVLHSSYLWGIALNWVCIPGINFLIYLYWVFNVGSWSKRKIL